MAVYEGGSAGDRYFAPDDQNNTLYGYAGDDSLYGGRLGDTIYGGADDDYLVGDDGADSLRGDSGDDTLLGGEGADRLEGGLGFNAMSGGGGSDVFYSTDLDTVLGGDGDDLLYSYDSVLDFDGGAGFDEVSYELEDGAVGVNLAANFGTGFAAGHSWTSVEDVTGSDFADHLVGSSAANVLDGRAGDDVVRGGAGADTLLGGAGRDALDYSGSAARVVINLATGAASGGDAQGDSFAEFERVNGTAYGDAIAGSARADGLFGYGGSDALSGGAGNDTLGGGAGNDRLTGSTGSDRLYGQGGADTFVYSSLADSTAASAGRDVITDYSRAGGDVVDLSRIDADSLFAGNQAFDFIAKSAFSGAGAELRYATSASGYAIVSADVDGDRVSDFSIRLEGVSVLRADDFIL